MKSIKMNHFSGISPVMSKSEKQSVHTVPRLIRKSRSRSFQQKSYPAVHLLEHLHLQQFRWLTQLPKKIIDFLTSELNPQHNPDAKCA